MNDNLRRKSCIRIYIQSTCNSYNMATCDMPCTCMYICACRNVHAVPREASYRCTYILGKSQACTVNIIITLHTS